VGIKNVLHLIEEDLKVEWTIDWDSFERWFAHWS
jgi:hypothetical protein